MIGKHGGPEGLFLLSVQPCAQLQQNSAAQCECDLWISMDIPVNTKIWHPVRRTEVQLFCFSLWCSRLKASFTFHQWAQEQTSSSQRSLTKLKFDIHVYLYYCVKHYGEHSCLFQSSLDYNFSFWEVKPIYIKLLETTFFLANIYHHHFWGTLFLMCFNEIFEIFSPMEKHNLWQKFPVIS